MDRIKTYQEFWPYYLQEHSKSATKWFHFWGTTLALAVAVGAAVTGKPAMLLLALVAGYGPAWFSHFFIEKNRPATFKYPLWSFISDFKMWFLLPLGKLPKH
jgi:hypothetical protein